MVKLRILNILLLLLAMHFSISNVYAQKVIHYYNPTWSPDGTKLLFESTRDGKSSIFTISIDGSDLKKLTDTIYDYGQPAWSPDGRSIVYYGSQQPMQLFTNSSTGGMQTELPTPLYDAYEPNCSSNQILVFNSRKIGQTPNDISIMNINGTSLKIITDSSHDFSSPAWSPDGTKILFKRSVAIRKKWKDITPEERIQMRDSSEIMSMNADGSNIQNLTKNNVRDISPSWSPDGHSFYYLSEVAAGKALFKQKIKTGKRKQICMLHKDMNRVSISPDQKYLAYAAERENKSAVYILDIRKNSETVIIGD
ncbi:MAG: PD40 domain-containing protein [Saprospiraceae bacterium]|uniref:PD40 domain-containing protein n=1 Tax=Candidatus Opimibacter skivensis TaxID=2982028 RepID=A0A9D7SXX4_9BACT|nr:PD40 domain-containing protein [Candidatus Opimibacter skivensis]